MLYQDYFMSLSLLCLMFLPVFEQESHTPFLYLPMNEAVMDNGCVRERNTLRWRFLWSNIANTSRYHLMVSKQGAETPFIDRNDITTNLFCYIKNGYYIAENQRFGWRWKVRAQVNGIWGEWSLERTFVVEPLDTDCE